jgi:hypothetical protein
MENKLNSPDPDPDPPLPPSPDPLNRPPDCCLFVGTVNKEKLLAGAFCWFVVDGAAALLVLNDLKPSSSSPLLSAAEPSSRFPSREFLSSPSLLFAAATASVRVPCRPDRLYLVGNMAKASVVFSEPQKESSTCRSIIMVSFSCGISETVLVSPPIGTEENLGECQSTKNLLVIVS